LSLGQSLNGISDQASLVLGDLNNDSLVDLVISGTKGTRILDIYMNNGSEFVLNESMGGYGTTKGSLGLIDYDKDGDLDIGQTGLGDSSYVSRIFNNN